MKRYQSKLDCLNWLDEDWQNRSKYFRQPINYYVFLPQNNLVVIEICFAGQASLEQEMGENSMAEIVKLVCGFTRPA